MKKTGVVLLLSLYSILVWGSGNALALADPCDVQGVYCYYQHSVPKWWDTAEGTVASVGNSRKETAASCDKTFPAVCKGNCFACSDGSTCNEYINMNPLEIPDYCRNAKGEAPPPFKWF